MGFRLKRRESVDQGVRRIVRERIDDARSQLARTGAERHEGIHEARKRFKEIRAALRLVRDAMGDRFVVENRWYRDTARSLSQTRDAQAVIETWDKLIDRFPERTSAKDFAAVRERLVQRLETVTASGNDSDDAAGQVLQGLESARERVGRWLLPDGGFDGIAPGLARGYAKGRQAMSDAFSEDTDEAFHEWRKRVKDHWYHTRILEFVWPAEMAARKKELKVLSELLGDDHDLVVLSALMNDQPRLFGHQRTRSRLLGLIGARRRELKDQARRLGALIYAEKPKAFRRRAGAYWKVWREGEKD